MTLYRNRMTGEIVSMTHAVSPVIINPLYGDSVSVNRGDFFYWTTDMNPPGVRIVNDAEIAARWEKVPFSSVDETSTISSYEKTLPREVDIRVDRGDIICVIGDATIIIRKSDDEQDAS